jgi:hypothetical protein
MAQRPFGLAILATVTMVMAAHSSEPVGLVGPVQGLVQPVAAQRVGMVEGVLKAVARDHAGLVNKIEILASSPVVLRK